MRKILLLLSLAFSVVTAYGNNPDSESTLIDAICHFDNGEFQQAADSLDLLIQRDSTVDAAYYYLGLLEFARKNTGKATELLQTAVSMDSTNLWYKETLASLYSQTGDNQKANDIYLLLLQKDPKKYRNHFTLSIQADQYLAQGMDSLALDSYNQSLMYDHSYPPSLIGIADVYFSQKEYGKFFDQVNKVFSNTSINDEPKREYLTNILRNFGESNWGKWKNEIKGLASTMIQAHPNSFETIDLAFQIDYLYKDYQDAISKMYSYAQLAEGDTAERVKALSTIGDLYQYLGDMASCYRIYNSVLSIDPEYAPVLNNYAYFLCLSGKKLSKALKMSKVAVTKEPDNPTYLDTYGWVLYNMKKYKEARPVFKHAIVYGGKQNSEVLEHFSKVLEALGETELANYYKLLIKK